MKNQNHTPNQTLTQQEIIAFLRAHKAQLERDSGGNPAVARMAMAGRPDLQTMLSTTRPGSPPARG